MDIYLDIILLNKHLHRNVNVLPDIGTKDVILQACLTVI